MRDANNLPEEFSTWKQVADYLGVSARQAQRWEREKGLPVRRLGGSSRVVALRDDIDRWKTASLIPRPIWRPSRKWLWGGVPLLAVLGLILAVTSAPKEPVSFRQDGSRLVVTDRRGAQLWDHVFPSPLYEIRPQSVLFAGLTNSSQISTLFAYHGINRAQEGAPLFCFSPRGSVDWTFAPGRAVSDVNAQYSPVYFVSSFRVIAAPSGMERWVVVSSNHSWTFPTQVAVLNSRGQILREYWHSGHLLVMAAADLDGDGVQEILLAGVRHGYEQAVLVVLDPRDVRGASVQPPGDSHQLQGFGPGSEKAVVFFPHTCITRLFEPYNRAVDVRGQDGRIEVHVSVTHVHENGPYLVYQLDRNLDVVGLSVSDGLHTRHKELETEGKLDHSLSKKEIEEWKQVRVVRPKR